MWIVQKRTPLVGTSVALAQLVGGAAACSSEADEGCSGFDWWSLDPNNTKMVHLLNMAVCSHDRMISFVGWMVMKLP